MVESYMMKFFQAYINGLENRTDKMGVWISGFFGSGKSHFLKILSYLLDNKQVYDEEGKLHNATSFFTEGVKVQNTDLKKEIQTIADYSNDVDVILFNIDSKSESDSKMNKEAIRDVFMKVFNDYLGYCGSIPFLAEFERKLDADGVYESFKTKFEEINGSSWVDTREDFYFIQDEIIETVTELGIMSEKEANNWAENAQNTYSMSVEKFAQCVHSYCASKGKNHHVVFLVDEIGQYIADDSQLMVNLQTVAEDLGTACKGKAWIVVTSQQDIDSITKTMGNDFSKIQGRFDTRIALSSANVDEVIRKRILYKKEIAAAILRDLYGDSEAVLKGMITFSEGTPDMPLYKDAEDFAEVYPFIPYQFKLLGNVLTSVRQYSSSGKHLADGERSMLALFKEAAEKYENEREGILVPFNAFYSALDDFIDADVIGYAKQVERLINLPEPYNFINKLEEFAIRLQNAITELLEKDAKRIEPDVYADRKIAMEAVLEDRPYADIVSKKINQKFEALLDKLKRTNDIAALNGIPSESNALLENCLADIKNEEAAYQRAQVQQQPSGDKAKEQPDVTPVKVIHTEPITMRTLTRGKSYSIKDSDDVEAFLQEIRRELMAKLGDDKVIKLS